MLQTKVVEKLEAHVLRSISFFSPENRAVYEITWKNTVEGAATGDNMAHAHCMLDT